MDLSLQTMCLDTSLRSQQYGQLLKKLDSKYPAFKHAAENFYKTQSQFMDNMLTVSAPTELRNLRQILAEINKSTMALSEAYFANKKKDIQIKQKQQALGTSVGLDKELLEVEIAELTMQIGATMDHVKGAVRKIAAYMTQYDNILNSLGKTEFTEQDFEDDEERYHIMKAFEQGLCAARAHGGIIDEGNQIYFHQIGLNGGTAQAEVSHYLATEIELLKKGIAPFHSMTMDFLKKMAEKYKHCAKDYAVRKGMTLSDPEALLTQSEAPLYLE